MPAVERPTVLLVEDDDLTSALVVAVLQNEFHVEAVSGGEDAVQLLLTRNYPVVLLDLRMPALDGYEVLARVRERRPEVVPRIVIFTAALSPAEIEKVQEFAVWGIVKKPFDVETLRGAVRSCSGTSGESPFPGLTSGGAVILLLAPLLQ